MKKAIILALAAFSAAVSQAQPNFNGYALGEHTISFTADNRSVTYKYTNDDFYIDFYSASNMYNRMPMVFTATGDLKGYWEHEVIPGAFTTPDDGQADIEKMVGIVSRVITEVDGHAVRSNINPHSRLRLVFAVNVGTGKVFEILFTFETEEGWDEVSPRAYHFIDEALKREMSYTITDFGRQLAFLRLYVSIYLPEVN